MRSVRADKDVRPRRKSVRKMSNHFIRALFVTAERLPEANMVPQPREQGVTERGSIDLTRDVAVALTGSDVKREAMQFASVMVQEDERGRPVRLAGRRSNEREVRLRQADTQGLAAGFVDRQAIALPAHVGAVIALKDGDATVANDQCVREAQATQAAANNDHVRSSVSGVSVSVAREQSHDWSTVVPVYR